MSAHGDPIVRSFHHAETGTWTHVVVDSATRHAAIIDSVLDFDPASGLIRTDSAQRVLEYVATAELHVEWVLETHAHADHLSAGAWLCERTGAKLGIGAGIVDVQRAFQRLLALDEDFPTDGSPFDSLFADGESFRVGDLEVLALATPGHTGDSISYLVGNVVFVGDTLFAPHAGTARCDFPGGDAAALYRSVMRLYDLPDATRVFLCHDYPPKDVEPVADVALGAEKAGNLFLSATTTEAAFTAARMQRDATLATPRLLWPAIQVNLRGGRLPPSANGARAFLKLPVRFQAT
jgi:glyoxylase-like metal-dependent hydrolase (beta-lactamase superfamily II)